MSKLLLLLSIIGITCFNVCADDKLPPNLEGEKVVAMNKELPDYKKLHKLVSDKKKPIIWLITGDSITHGAQHTRGIRDYTECFKELMKWEMRRTDDLIINTGVSGEMTPGLLAKFDWRVAQFKPQIVSVNLGMNDTLKVPPAEFKKNIEKLVEKIRDLGAIPIIQTPTPTAVGEKRRAEKLIALDKAIYEVAVEKKVLLVDHASHWQKFAGKAEERKTWMNDQIHPNGKGHAEMFKVMAWQLGLFNGKHFTCKQGAKTIK